MSAQDDMVERVARAVFKAGEDAFPDASGTAEWDAVPPADKHCAMVLARAAIEAMREPTEAMDHAARDWSRDRYGRPIGKDASRGCWQVQIDAALTHPANSLTPQAPA